MTAGRDVVVVGAGIVGLATARALLLRRPGLQLTVLEQEAAIGSHQTSHNSGVLHSGVYYAPGSLKAALCRRGKRELEAYADERGLPIARPGKLIVALDGHELPRLDELERRARENGVEGLRRLDAAELRELEPHAAGVAGLHVPETGIIDYGRVAASLARDVADLGATVALRSRVVAIAEQGGALRVRTAAGAEVEARALVGCAGLHSDRLARLSGVPTPARIVPFRGDYYTLRAEARHLVRGLLYPVPDPAFPFLGVHFTPRIDGSVIVGPNAVLALARDRYRRAAFRWRDATEALGYAGTRRFAWRHARVAVGEVWRDISKRAFVADLRRYVPALAAGDVTFGPTGIRAQAMTREGRLIDDFLIVGSRRTMHLVNAPSPAATASFAIGDEVAARALADLL